METIGIIGASLAGLSTARALRDEGFDGRIVVVGAETHLPYDRPPLSKEFLAGTSSVDDLALVSEDDESLDIEWRLGVRANRLDASRRAAILSDGRELLIDGLVVATGAGPRYLPGAADLDRVHVLRTLDDALALRDSLLSGGRLVVVGAGFIGSEIASTARGLGMDVVVVEAAPVPLAGAVGAQMGSLLAALHLDHGVRLITGVGVDRLVGDRRVTAVQLADGQVLPADVVVVGIGCSPATGWLDGSGINVDQGVLCDERCATNIPGVIAVGDVARAVHPFLGRRMRTEHWANATEHAVVAAATLLGRTRSDVPKPPYFWSDQYGIRIQFAGHTEPGDLVDIVDGRVDERCFTATYSRGDHQVAVLAVNQPRLFGRLRRQLAPVPLAAA